MTFCSKSKIVIFATNSNEVCYIIMNKLNPLNAELNHICYLLAYYELTIFTTLAGKVLNVYVAMEG